jgi:hypothetical protein
MSQIPAAGKSNQIKWSPREKKANQIQIKHRPRKPKWDQMAARESPAIWRFNHFSPHNYRRALANRSSSTLLSPTHDSGAIRSKILLARLMRRMSVCEFGFVVPCARTKTQFIFCAGNEHVLVGEVIQDHHH